MNDPYAMPNGVLHNKLGITDHQLLAAAEADITRARLVMLAERPLPGAYDGNLVPYAREVFGRLASSGHLRDLARQEFVNRLAELYGDLNVLHPFREGNRRAQPAFLAQLSADAGYDLNWSGVDPQRNEDASVKSFYGDNSLLEQVLDELITTPG
ncbi:Fic/DOC family protein [Streptomyces sp. NPDC051445]|uniref:Fic/DOC family protein n=1 Tax=Streptomyces sp. NPDC051445 TaxID=3365653 RepID=UPI0037998FF4